MHSVKGSIIYLVALTRECAPAYIFEMINRIHKILCTYLTTVDSTTIKTNFGLIYEVLDEILDYGHPLITEPSALIQVVEPPSVMNRVLKAIAV